MSNIRNAALHLYSLHSKDREWILERLPENMQNNLKPLINELQSLNLSQESVNDYTGELLIEHDGEAQKELRHKVKQIENTDIAIVKQCLSSEPAEVIACVVRIMPVRWQKMFLEYADYECKKDVYDYLSTNDFDVSDNVLFSLLHALLNSISRVESGIANQSDEALLSAGKPGRRIWRR